MAKLSLLTHPKFRRLTRLLGLGEAQAVGHLELLWHVAYEVGSADIGDATDVEAAARWEGTAGALCAALVDCKLLDVVSRTGETEQYAIHDLADHCPKYVKDRLAKRLQRAKMSETRRTKVRRVAQKERRSSKKVRHVAVSLPSPSLPIPTPPLAAQEEGSSSFPTRSGAWELPPDKRAELASNFHWLDLSVELSKARAWLLANPDRRKTARGMFRFLMSWMSNARRGPGPGFRPPPGTAAHLSGIQEFVQGGESPP